ncbi:MAG TPA: hypothetical protein VN759_02275, partial [Pseudolysinimonas sp.]|nr:hypothetical protein [Pseudolysinimonas sp.]
MNTRTIAGLALAVGGALDAVGAIAYRAGAPLVGFLFTLVGLALIGAGLLLIFRSALLPLTNWGRIAGLIAAIATFVEALLVLLGQLGLGV